MRMWMVEPRLLCRKHLLGEHSEIHKHRHVFEKGWSIDKRIELPNPQIEPLSMESRHDEIVKEMKLRGYNHQSPFKQPSLSKYNLKVLKCAIVNKEHSLNDLHCRCVECKEILTK